MTDQQTTPDVGTSASPEGTSQAHEQGDATGILTPAGRAQRKAQQKAQEKAAGAGRRSATPWFRKKRVTLPAAAILLVGILAASTGGRGSGIFGFAQRASTSGAGSPARVLPATATIGQSVRDGAFAFNVSYVQPPIRTVTDRFGAAQTAEGLFVIVRVNVTNIGYEPRKLTATDQFLAGDNGERFATSAAISSLKGAETIFSEKINPGHTVESAPLLFDVPSGTIIKSIEFHDSLTSTGVKVKLS